MKQRDLHSYDDGGGDCQAQKKSDEAGEETTSTWMT
jgi:hypothetical protein